MPELERSYIPKVDRLPDNQTEAERLGLIADEMVMDTVNGSLDKYRARLSTADEDSGKRDIGPRQTIDVVVYYENRPAMALQVTTSKNPDILNKKLQQIKDRPFLRLPEMKRNDVAIPKLLLEVDRKYVKDYDQDASIANTPEVVRQFLDRAIFGLEFSLTQTLNPVEIKAIEQLKADLESRKDRLNQ